MNYHSISRFSAIAIIALLAASCGKSDKSSEDNQTAQQLAAARDSLQTIVADQQALLELYTELSQGMEEIKELEKLESLTPANGVEGRNRRDEIITDINAVQERIKEREARLAELEDRLKQSDRNNTTLTRTIAQLKSQIVDQETTITQLRNRLRITDAEVERLNASVDTLTTIVETTTIERDEALRDNEMLTDQLNLCYYAIGNKSELKKHNLIETGFLKKTKIMPADFEQTYFTPADKRTLTIIPLASKKAKVLTAQPEDSYEILTDANTKAKTLKITNPDRFWEKSNYLVIQID